MALCHQVKSDIRHARHFAIDDRMPAQQQAGNAVSKIKRPAAYSAIQVAIGQRIKWARELVEPNRAEFARLLGVDRTTLQKIEDGDRAPSVFNVLDIAHRLRVSCDYVLSGSLRGVDGELAAMLVTRHPELLNHSHTAMAGGTSRQPKTPA